MKKRLFHVALVLLSAACASAAKPMEGSKPNILVIVADDLGFSDLGCYGSEIATPNLDRLAGGGVKFTQFYNSARCCPSRASLLTGLHPHKAGVGLMLSDNGPEYPGYRGFLTSNSLTLAEALKLANYRTYMVGKWHVGPKSQPLARGFDEFYGMIHGFGTFWKEKPAYRRLPADRAARAYAEGEFYATDAFGDYATDFIRDAAEKAPEQPWFLYLTFNAPHFPLHARPDDIAKDAKMYEQGWDKIREARLERQKKLGLWDEQTTLPERSNIPPNWVATPHGWAGKQNPAWDEVPVDRQKDLARRMAIYAAMVDRMDQNIGRVLAELQNRGEMENTLILFLSDNGACAEWDPWGFDTESGPDNVLHIGAELEKMGGPETYHSYGSGWANASNTPLRLYKHYIHEGGISSPFIVHWAAAVSPKPDWEKQPAGITDIMPTVLKVAGLEYPAHRGQFELLPLVGRSILGILQGVEQPEREFAWEHDGNRGIRHGDWKLVSVGSARWELYNLSVDRLEQNDLATDHPDRVRNMAAAWQTWAGQNHVLPSPPANP